MAVSSNGVTYEVVCVHSLDEVYQAIREHELSKSTKYVTVKKDKMFGKDDFDLLHSEVRFEDTQKSTVPYISYDGVLFIIVGRKRMACHHGKDTHSKEKERKKGKDHQVGDHDYKKTRKLLQTTKKKDCSAGIRVRHVIRFPDYKVSDCGKRSEKDAASLSIKQKIRTGQIIRKEHTFFVSIPDDSEHENHFMGEDASLIQPIDEDLKKYIGLMVVQHQVGNTFQMKLLLEVYVKQTLFDGQNIPSRLNKRFWPSIKDIKNHMALALLRLRNTNVDQ
ncbi:calcium-responsive transcription factor-like, partial [Mytilus edulis]|uniref:calcium-responsive transcription factor-like n=1 Tax=Mytilus edulis TaxID=6550 RepID=UPI0039EEC7B4